MVDVSINFCGVRFKNPVLVASGTFGFGVEYRNIIDLNKLGGIVFKSITVDGLIGNKQPRIYELPYGLINSIGLENKGINWLIKDLLPQLDNVNTELIPSIYGFSFEEYVELLKKLNDISRFKLIEVNISCPNVHSIIHKLERDLVVFETFVKTIRRSSKKVLIVKLSPSIYNIVDFAKKAAKNGIDAVSLINTIPAITFDWRKRKSNISTMFGGFSGPPLKAISQKLCMDIYRNVDIPIIGIGGISNAEDVMEYIACGARLIEIGTANFIKPDISQTCAETLDKILEKEKIDSIDEFTGSFIWANAGNNVLKIYTDGASFGNPGPSSCSYIFKNQKDEFIMSRGFFLGHTTNNVAEYNGLLKAIEFLEKRKIFLNYIDEIQMYSDSELLVRQLKGVYKVKDMKLKELNALLLKKIKNIGKSYQFFEISREKNIEADRITKEVLQNRG